MCSREDLNKDIDEINISKVINSLDWNKKLLNLKSSNDFTGLREKLIDISMPYKNDLIRLWKEDREFDPDTSIAKYINNYEGLFIK